MKVFLPLFAAALVIAPGVHAQQPPDVVKSDSQQNTAMGTGALQSVYTSTQSSLGASNTAAGYEALFSNTSGENNVAVGDQSLWHNTTGSMNVAVGEATLYANTTGDINVALGEAALSVNTTGGANIAIGWNALEGNTTGSFNTAVGVESQFGGTTHDNSALGYRALATNQFGNDDTAVGWSALKVSNGSENTAIGSAALYAHNSGNDNTAAGSGALFSTMSGNENTAVGHHALYSATTGSNNIALGTNAGMNVTSGSNDIAIGNPGTASDAGTIRIGTSGSHTATYVAGVTSAKVTGSAVYVAADGRLGVLASSERYKTAIADMGDRTDGLGRLKPVTFQLKSDPTATLQYGLIAEDVAKVYPELVTRDEAGTIQGVRYEELTPMLLNELQKQKLQLSAQTQELTEMHREVADLRKLKAEVELTLAALRSSAPR